MDTRLEPIQLSEGVSRRNALTYLCAAFFTIGLVAVISFMQPYLLSNNLGLSPDEEGRASLSLQVAYELVVLVAVGPLGALADRIGEGAAILSGAGVIGQESPEHIRGSVLGFFNFCGSAGIVAISAVGGWLFDAWMPEAPFIFVGLINLTIFGIAVGVRRRMG